MKTLRGTVLRKHLVSVIIVVSAWWLLAHFSQAGPEQAPARLRLDQQGDPLPGDALLRLGTSRWRSGKWGPGVESLLAFSPNGRYAIAPGQPTRLLDAVTGKRLREFPMNSYAAFFTSDSKSVMLRDEKEIRYLDIESGTVTRRLPFPDLLLGVAWSADGKRLAGSYGKIGGPWAHYVWDLERGEELFRWQKPTGDNHALSVDGTLVAVRSREQIGVLSVTDKKLVAQWRSVEPDKGRTPNACVVAFLPDNKTLVALESKRVVLWDPKTGQLKPQGKLGPILPTGRDEPVTLAVSTNGRYLAAGGSAGTLYIWDLEADALLHTIPGNNHDLPVYNLTFTPDSKRLVSQTHYFPSARVWDVVSGKEASPTGVPTADIHELAFSPDSKTLATVDSPGLSGLGTIRLWDVASGKLLHHLEHGRLGLQAGGLFAFHPSGKLLLTTSGPEAALWSLPDAALRNKFKGVHPDHTPGKNAGYIELTNCWPVEDRIVALFPGEVRRVIRGTRGGPDQELRWNRIGLVNPQTGEVERSFRIGATNLRHCCLSPDGRLLAAVGQLNDRTDGIDSLLVWDLQRGVEQFHVDDRIDAFDLLSFSRDSRTVVTTSNKYPGRMFLIFEVASGKPRVTLTQMLDSPPIGTRHAAVASDSLAVLGAGTTIVLFDPVSGKEFRRLETSWGEIHCLAFSPDGKRLAAAGDDTTAVIWDVSGLVTAESGVRLGEEDLTRLWTRLLSPDAETAYQALRELARAPDQTVAYLSKHLQPSVPMSAGRVKALIAQLDSDNFTDREQAGRELLQLADLAEPALVEASKSPPSLEARVRIQKLLKQMQERKENGPYTLSEGPLRDWRAVELLERIATPGAERLLERLAKGDPQALLTRQADMAARRLVKQVSRP